MKIKTFLKKWVLNNIGYKILAVVFAFILWLVILNVTDPDTTKTISSIPVTIENEDSVLNGSQIYEILSGETTSVTVTGSRSIVSALNADDFVAIADFSELSTNNTVLIDVSLTGDMSKYSSKVDIAVKTQTMVISIDEITTLKVTVEISYTGELAENEFVDSASVTPESVTITAPQSILNKISSVVAYIDYADIDASSAIRTQLYIYDSDGSEVDLGSYGSVDYSSVLVEIGASYTKTVSIYMEDPEDTTADGYEFSSLSYSVSSVTIKGSKDLIDSIDVIELPNALIDLSDAESNVSVLVSLSDYLPDGVSVYNSSSSVLVTALVVESEETSADESEEETDTEDESETESSTQDEEATGEGESLSSF